MLGCGDQQPAGLGGPQESPVVLQEGRKVLPRSGIQVSHVSKGLCKRTSSGCRYVEIPSAQSRLFIPQTAPVLALASRPGVSP